MIAIDQVLISDDVVTEHFICDLEQCKGGCCVDGDCGAPLTEEEAKIITQEYNAFKPYLEAQYIPEIERQGMYVTDDQHGTVTPTVNGGICVYGFTDERGIVKCGIEKAWQNGATTFQKPISCHLFPIRVIENDGFEAINYEPRKSLCRPACKLGRKHKLPVYQFLKDAITRKYGSDFYNALDAVAKQFKKYP
jgi:hypothetical protein